MKYFAHSLPGRPQEEWQILEDHLKNVAEMAKRFASEFGAREWGYLAGLWHVGKSYPKGRLIVHEVYSKI